MNIELQKVTIAEHMGWSASPNMGAIGGYIARHPDGGGCYHNIGHDRNHAIALNCPDYLADLNAMAEAEKMLTPEQQRTYAQHLQGRQMGGMDYLAQDFRAIHSTASLRAEMFLRTIGKWQDTPTPASEAGPNP